jgi:hypothetical protein
MKINDADAMKKTRTIDFNSVLMGANLLFAALLVFTFSNVGGNEYIDRETVMLGMLLAGQTHIALWFERRRRDPFVILLALAMTFYYQLRLVTLTWDPFSVVFGRYSYDASNTNFALIFIIVANLALYAGLGLGRLRGGIAVRAGTWKATSPMRAVALMMVAITFAYFGGHYWNEDNVPRAFNFLATFIAQDVVVLMALAYYFVFKQSLSKGSRLFIVIMVLTDIVVHTLLGSRSGIVGTLQQYIWVTLAIGGCIRFRRKAFVLGVALTPLLVGLLVVSFAISTYNRAFREGGTLDVSQAFALAIEGSSELSLESTIERVVPAIADRIGFFDYSAEIIAHREEYSSVINLPAYGRSIVDNLLTPGFDVYDQPKISNALQFVYEGLGTPSKEQVSEAYRSDQLGLYGELYALFGYASLPLFLLIAWLMKTAYGRMTSESPFILVMKRVVVLYVFARTLDSYGFDWTIVEVVPRVVAIYMYRFCFQSMPGSPREPVSRTNSPRPIGGGRSVGNAGAQLP